MIRKVTLTKKNIPSAARDAWASQAALSLVIGVWCYGGGGHRLMVLQYLYLNVRKTIRKVTLTEKNIPSAAQDGNTS